ncbi:MAG TPA: hypothetical protein VFI47_06505 [Acidimicrobiales bacterium]|nr:hypothetical protein [Acidimicrobiales bacterium]
MGTTIVAGPGARGPAAAVTTLPRPHRVHRWRDLGRGDRRWAVAAGIALLAAPLVAFLWFTPDWLPTGDPALMGLRALDTGTSRTPLLGQPSQSRLYAESIQHVHHPGPLHFYLMALPVRLLGGAWGMPLVSVAITGTCLVTSAWAVFRQLGRRAGLVAALALSAVAFTTGASSLLNPVSSNIAGYPLLCSAVLLWCVACGDVRLLPVATAAVTFTAQQHLSVVPATVVIAAGGLGLAAWRWRRSDRRHDPDARRELARYGAWSAAVALVLWAPVLVQQAFGEEGNLGQMIWFAQNGNSDTLGWVSAVWQAAHVLGLPPLLGRTNITGEWLVSRPTAVTWLTAASVIAAVVWRCRRWRGTDGRRALLGPMAGVVLAAGLVNGSSVPVGIEQHRLQFYHWAFVLALFVALVAGLAASDWLRVRIGARRPGVARLGAALVVALVAVPSLVNPRLERITNRDSAAYVHLPRDAVESLAGAVVEHGGLGDQPVVLSRNEPLYVGFREALAYELVERGVPVRHPLGARFFVHDQHLVDRDRVTGGVVLVVDGAAPTRTPPGDLVATASLDGAAAAHRYRALLAAARDDEVVLGAGAEAALAGMIPAEHAFMAAALGAMGDAPEHLLNPLVLDFLLDHPVMAPAFDRADLRAVRDALAGGWDPDDPAELRVYVLDRPQVLATGRVGELGRDRD